MRIRGRERLRPEISQVSMSDVAFLLLIFFLSTTIFDFEVGIPVVLPGIQAAPIPVDRHDLLTIRTAEDGSVTIDGVPVILDQVQGTVRDRLDRNPELIVHLVTHPRVPYRAMIDLLDEVRKADATRISLKLGRD